jgi:demethoxyubiquinone hydroxylase (CLK1/Coq7/Cat5 family)
MKAGEEEHLATLSGLLARRRVRPTALLPRRRRAPLRRPLTRRGQAGG